MNDEKKLPDETVEGVAGGNVQRTPQTPEIMFMRRNCRYCRLRTGKQDDDQSCPYKNSTDAFMQLNGADCPSKR